ncbi:MAG: hypothetical protein LBG97_06725 [Coriobacteriales bacterium]|jgi:hypothetical protein|nr:hypothetical protein [Coriobacteriales bacterium]
MLNSNDIRGGKKDDTPPAEKNQNVEPSLTTANSQAVSSIAVRGISRRLLLLLLALIFTSATAGISWAWHVAALEPTKVSVAAGVIKLNNSNANVPIVFEDVTPGTSTTMNSLKFVNDSNRLSVVEVSVDVQSWLRLLEYKSVAGTDKPVAINQDFGYLLSSDLGVPSGVNADGLIADLKKSLALAGLNEKLLNEEGQSGLSLLYLNSNLPESLKDSSDVFGQRLWYGSAHLRELTKDMRAALLKHAFTQLVRNSIGDATWVPQFTAVGFATNTGDLRAYINNDATKLYVAFEPGSNIDFSGLSVTVSSELCTDHGPDENNAKEADGSFSTISEKTRLNEGGVRFSISFEVSAAQGTADAVVDVFGLSEAVARTLTAGN